ncbi:DNA repair protein RecO [Aquincola tertiaricarbonis]|uniref:DNA repair protein RecO n=1 Tax=Aquincola tertiaricarbonis TaxID=391953 RepID=UPI00061511E5|nr:DNA repair protein RecO [Aquincola tertiaricarbonis]
MKPHAAYVLHQYDWSESSLIVDLFTRDLGRVVVAAKGAKRPYSQLRPVLLPFQRLNIGLGKPPKNEEASDIQNLRGAEWAGPAAVLRGDALFSGFYLNELLLKLLGRHDPHPRLFDAYAETLQAVAGPDDQRAQAALRAFELTLLQQIGLLPDLALVTHTQAAVQAAERYALQPEAGVIALADGPFRGPQLIGLQAALEHGSLQALQQACAAPLGPLRTALRGLLHYHLGTPQLRTRQVMLDVQKLVDSTRAPR